MFATALAVSCGTSAPIPTETTERVIIYAPIESTSPELESLPEPRDPLLVRAEEILAEMTLDEKLGQLILAHVPSLDSIALDRAKWILWARGAYTTGI